MGFVWFLLVGGGAGWLAGQFMKGSGFGVMGNIGIGIVGGMIGGFLFGILGINLGGMIGSLTTATIGAVVLLYIVRAIKKA